MADSIVRRRYDRQEVDNAPTRLCQVSRLATRRLPRTDTKIAWKGDERAVEPSPVHEERQRAAVDVQGEADPPRHSASAFEAGEP